MPVALTIATTALTVALGSTPATASQLTVTPVDRAVTVSVPAAGSTGTSYTVRRGDTVGKIARRTGTSVTAIVSANKLARGGYRIRPGQVLRIPSKATPVKAAPVKAAPVKAAKKKPATPPATAKRTPKGTTTTTKKSTKTPTKATKPTKAVTVKPTVKKSATKKATKPTTTVRTKPAAPDKALATGLIPAKGYRPVVSAISGQAKARGVDRNLALAISYQESRWDQARVSNVGALGAMQIMPANRAWLSKMSGRELDLRKTEDNATAGVVLLKWLDKQAKGNQDMAIGAYYQGMPSMKKRGPYRETTRYIASVKSHKAKITASAQLGK